jgi:hypothetical protein
MAGSVSVSCLLRLGPQANPRRSKRACGNRDAVATRDAVVVRWVSCPHGSAMRQASQCGRLCVRRGAMVGKALTRVLEQFWNGATIVGAEVGTALGATVEGVPVGTAVGATVVGADDGTALGATVESAAPTCARMINGPSAMMPRCNRSANIVGSLSLRNPLLHDSDGKSGTRCQSNDPWKRAPGGMYSGWTPSLHQLEKVCTSCLPLGDHGGAHAQCPTHTSVLQHGPYVHPRSPDASTRQTPALTEPPLRKRAIGRDYK